MAKKTKKATAKLRPAEALKYDELDSIYLLKLVLYLIAGSFWLRLQHGGAEIPIPVGLMVGILFTAHEKFQIDRKVEYALLLVAAFISFWLPIGLAFNY